MLHAHGAKQWRIHGNLHIVWKLIGFGTYKMITLDQIYNLRSVAQECQEFELAINILDGIHLYVKPSGENLHMIWMTSSWW